MLKFSELALPAICPFQFTLRATEKITLPAHHAAVLYGTVASAYASESSGDRVFPDGAMLSVVEQCRQTVTPDSTYRFGITVVAKTESDADATAERLWSGLIRWGVKGKARRTGFGGNFVAESIEPLAGTRSASASWSSAIAREHLQDEVERVQRARSLTLHFHSPLRWIRPKALRRPGAAFFDAEKFLPDTFARRLCDRLTALGIEWPVEHISRQDWHVDANELIWLDLAWGRDDRRKSLGGCVGRIRTRLHRKELSAALVLGQYLHVGANTRFGFGAYRIEELGPPQFLPMRAVGLVQLALDSGVADDLAARYGIGSGQMTERVSAVRSGTYQPGPVHRVVISETNRARTLAIPTIEDRVLQRAVLDVVAPALDEFFELSSLAYRKGLGRHKAAQRIRECYRDGYQWAVRSDFHSFFDSIEHRLLEQRLEGYVADPELCSLIMRWVVAGAPQKGRGLPTGSPLSPVLANLFLDQFDEDVAATGGRLVRYADDFLILFRDQDRAKALFDAASQAAERLRLTLNDDKTHLLDLTAPFEFLGYRFHRDEQWEIAPSGELSHIDDLGWRQARRGDDLSVRAATLPGEAVERMGGPRSSYVVGPNVVRIHIRRRQLICELEGEGDPRTIPLERAEDLVVFGPPTIDRSVLAQRNADQVFFLADAAGRNIRVLQPERAAENAKLIDAQVQRAADDAFRHTVSGALVTAKITNYASLASSLQDGHPSLRETASRMHALGERARKARGTDELLGFEGAAAAAWYGSYGATLGRGFQFEGRVAPSAEDPVNVLLNIGFTLLHRLCQLAVAREGMISAIGFLHRAYPGHAALASDLQEPFRHLVDRAVIRATSELRPSQFKVDRDGKYPLRIEGSAARRFVALLLRDLAIPCKGVGDDHAKPYRHQMNAVARSLHRATLDPEIPLKVFRHQ